MRVSLVLRLAPGRLHRLGPGAVPPPAERDENPAASKLAVGCNSVRVHPATDLPDLADTIRLPAVIGFRPSSEEHGDRQDDPEDQCRQNGDGYISGTRFAGFRER